MTQFSFAATSQKMPLRMAVPPRTTRRSRIEMIAMQQRLPRSLASFGQSDARAFARVALKQTYSRAQGPASKGGHTSNAIFQSPQNSSDGASHTVYRVNDSLSRSGDSPIPPTQPLKHPLLGETSIPQKRHRKR